MSRVRWSLRTRLVVVFGATFVLMQLANAAYLLQASRGATRARLETAAHQYAVIATPVVVQSFDTYFDSGYFKFRQLVIDLLARTEDVSALGTNFNPRQQVQTLPISLGTRPIAFLRNRLHRQHCQLFCRSGTEDYQAEIGYSGGDRQDRNGPWNPG